MKEKITIKRKDINNINLELYIDAIINELYGDSIATITTYENSNICEIMTAKKKKIVILQNTYAITEHKLKCIIDNIVYEYNISYDKKNIYLTLQEIKFTKNKEDYHITFIGNSKLINIKRENNATQFEMDDYLISKEELLEKISLISANDNLKETYLKIESLIEKPINEFSSLKIKKYIINNNNYSRENITDIISIHNNKLIEFMITINKNNKTYVIRKDNNNYSITLINAIVDNEISSFYFDINEEASFIKKLERKNKN